MPRRRSTPITLAVVLSLALFHGAGSTAQNSLPAGPRFRAPADPPPAHYTIDCRVDPTGGILTGTETVRFRNGSGEPISRLALDWEVGGKQTLGIACNGEVVEPLRDSGKTRLPAPVLFDLPGGCPPGRELSIVMKFTKPLSGLDDPIPTVITGWYPRLWWGFDTHDTVDVRIDAPEGFRAATSGRPDPSTGYDRAEGVRNCGLFLAREMHLLEAETEGVLIRCFYTPRGEECARLIFETAKDAVGFYRQKFGFYPSRILTIVPGFFDRPVGGYPAAPAMVAIHGQERMHDAPEIHWRWITAHEIGHQYWGEHVLEKDDPGWLWIGMGIWSDREYIRARGLSPQKHRQLMARYTDGVRKHLSTVVAVPSENIGDLYDAGVDYNNVVTHGKGFSIVSALDVILGHETFARIAARCLREFGGKRMGESEFRAVCESESGEDLGWFFGEWVHSNAFLSYEIASQDTRREGPVYLTTVRVERLGTLKMPVPVVATFGDGSVQRRLTDRLEAVSTLRFSSASPLTLARIDPDSELALVVPPPEMTQEEFLRSISRLPWSGGGDEAIALYRKAPGFKPLDGDSWGKLALNLYDGEYYPEALEAFRRTAEASAESSNWSFAAVVWQGHILDLMGRRQEALERYNRALGSYAGQEMHHGQYGMILNRAWVEERIRKPFRRD